MSLETKRTELSFEQAYTRLEELIQKLDEGGLSLDEALTCYEEASAMVARCNSVLDAAELRLRNVADREDGDDGEFEETAFQAG
ncbi:MAG: exodeoxyribonuclease VII small subunit [Chloroflexota bacterium]|nr:exodeoxyribonuclease VII small subunit [Chloroflexota bacterium]